MVLLRGDLNPILGFCFPLFSRVFPWGISVRATAPDTLTDLGGAAGIR